MGCSPPTPEQHHAATAEFDAAVDADAGSLGDASITRHDVWFHGWDPWQDCLVPDRETVVATLGHGTPFGVTNRCDAHIWVAAAVRDHKEYAKITAESPMTVAEECLHAALFRIKTYPPGAMYAGETTYLWAICCPSAPDGVETRFWAVVSTFPGWDAVVSSDPLVTVQCKLPPRD